MRRKAIYTYINDTYTYIYVYPLSFSVSLFLSLKKICVEKRSRLFAASLKDTSEQARRQWRENNLYIVSKWWKSWSNCVKEKEQNTTTSWIYIYINMYIHMRVYTVLNFFAVCAKIYPRATLELQDHKLQFIAKATCSRALLFDGLSYSYVSAFTIIFAFSIGQ